MDEQPTGHERPKGKDLPGAINVLPAGLGDVLKKRESREFKMEQSSSGMSFSTGARGGGEVQQTFASSKTAKEASSSFSASTISGQGQLQQQHLASSMASSSSMQQQKTTSSTFSASSATSQQQSFTQAQPNQQQRVLQQQPQPQAASIQHGEEIKQESLKTTIQSAITDLEQDIDKTVVDSVDKENQAPLPQQQQVISENDVGSSVTKQHNGHLIEEYKHGSEFDRKMKWPREYKGRPESMQELESYVPSTENLIGVPDFSELDGSGKMTEQFSMQQSKEQSMSMQTVTTSTFNGHDQQESQQQSFISASASNNPILEKALMPAGDADYDSSSLKRRNPHQMFTDSSFYSAKYHPTVADQVEQAHQLSSSLYGEGNKMSKGQEMYLKRAKTSGDTSDLEAIIPQHDKVPNLKLVMNPEGKLHDWTDLPEEEIPELQHTQDPEAARQMVENLQACKGRGKMRVEPKLTQPSGMTLTQLQKGMQQSDFTPRNKPTRGPFSRTSNTNADSGTSFQSSYAEVFKNRRGIFEQGSVFSDTNHRHLDNLNLAIPRVSNFAMRSKSTNKSKGNRVQFQEVRDNDENGNIANHYGQNVSNCAVVNSQDNSTCNPTQLTTETQNTDITNPNPCRVPFWKQLSRSNTAPNLLSPSVNLKSAKSQKGEMVLNNNKEPPKLSLPDNQNTVNCGMEDGVDNVPSPKVPPRNLSSHNYVVQFKRKQFETPKTKDVNAVEDSKQQNLIINKNKMTNLNKDAKGRQRFEIQKTDDEDETNNFYGRPLRDFF